MVHRIVILHVRYSTPLREARRSEVLAGREVRPQLGCRATTPTGARNRQAAYTGDIIRLRPKLMIYDTGRPRGGTTCRACPIVGIVVRETLDTSDLDAAPARQVVPQHVAPLGWLTERWPRGFLSFLFQKILFSVIMPPIVGCLVVSVKQPGGKRERGLCIVGRIPLRSHSQLSAQWHGD